MGSTVLFRNCRRRDDKRDRINCGLEWERSIVLSPPKVGVTEMEPERTKKLSVCGDEEESISASSFSRMGKRVRNDKGMWTR